MYVGLWLNRGRVETRLAYRTLTAVQAALELVFGGEPLKQEWFDAATDTEEQAKLKHGLHAANCQLNTERLENRARV